MNRDMLLVGHIISGMSVGLASAVIPISVTNQKLLRLRSEVVWFRYSNGTLTNLTLNQMW